MLGEEVLELLGMAALRDERARFLDEDTDLRSTARKPRIKIGLV